MTPITRIVLIAAITLVALSTHADQRLELPETRILGDTEQPHVVQILSWQHSTMPPGLDPSTEEYAARPPVDREEFVRMLEYRQRFVGSGGAKGR